MKGTLRTKNLFDSIDWIASEFVCMQRVQELVYYYFFASKPQKQPAVYSIQQYLVI